MLSELGELAEQKEQEQPDLMETLGFILFLDLFMQKEDMGDMARLHREWGIQELAAQLLFQPRSVLAHQ